MKIGCLQFNPQVGQVKQNTAEANHILDNVPRNKLKELDVLVLPELALTGYNFQSLEHITPFLETAGSGPTARWAAGWAKKLHCTVIVGYPEIDWHEKLDEDDPRRRALDFKGKGIALRAEDEMHHENMVEKAKHPGHYARYNSIVIVGPQGQFVGNYRKTFLYYTDETWACEGQGFGLAEIPGLGKAALGICMDINPYKFEAPWTAYEFTNHVLLHAPRIVILSMAWLTHDPKETFLAEDNVRSIDMDTLTYWVTRLTPLIEADGNKETYVVFANRCGVEDDVVYAGSSCVVGIKDGEARLYEYLARGTTKVLIVDTHKKWKWPLTERRRKRKETDEAEEMEGVDQVQAGAGARGASEGETHVEGESSSAAQNAGTRSVEEWLDDAMDALDAQQEPESSAQGASLDQDVLLPPAAPDLAPARVPVPDSASASAGLPAAAPRIVSVATQTEPIQTADS